MGKVKRLRQKLHIASKTAKPLAQISEDTNSQKLTLPLPNDDLFSGFNINVDTLKAKLNDDVQSVKSSKSTKSRNLHQVIIPKKDKLKKRREVLLKKIDAVNQMKKDLRLREKRKKIAVIGDTNPLHDALPSLESLLKNRPNIKQNITEPRKKRGIEKAKKRKKDLIQGVKMFKAVLDNKTFQKNPLDAISHHVQALVNQEKQKMKKL